MKSTPEILIILHDGSTSRQPAHFVAITEEAATSWIASRIQQFPDLKAEDLLVYRGRNVNLEIVPPEMTHRIVFGGEVPAAAKGARGGYKACVNGTDGDCKGIEGGKPGNAHGRARSLCAACYDALPADDARRIFRPRGAKVSAPPSAT